MTAPRFRTYSGGNERPPAQLTLWMGIVLGALTIVGALWASASQYGSLRTMVEEDHSVIMRMAAAVEKNTEISNRLDERQRTLDQVADRTSKLEARAERNWTAISRQGKQSEKNRSDISRQDVRQNQQATQQVTDRVTADVATREQSKRQDQSDTRQAAAATAAITAERVLSNRQDQDRTVAASTSQAIEERQDQSEAQQDTDRAAAAKRAQPKKR